MSDNRPAAGTSSKDNPSPQETPSSNTKQSNDEAVRYMHTFVKKTTISDAQLRTIMFGTGDDKKVTKKLLMQLVKELIMIVFDQNNRLELGEPSVMDHFRSNVDGINQMLSEMSLKIGKLGIGLDAAGDRVSGISKVSSKNLTLSGMKSSNDVTFLLF